MISIVIIVKNDRGVNNTILSIKKTKVPESETIEIVVVDASNGNLADIKALHGDVVWLDFESQNPIKKYTIPEQRNTGIKATKGNIVVFIDANCIPEHKWLVELVTPILIGEENITAGRVKSANSGTVHDLIAVRNKDRAYLEECPTINMAFKKDILKTTGDFDENFDYGSDIDFSWRAVEKGYRIKYCPDAIISHEWGTARDDFKRTYLYGQGRARIYKKHINHWKRLFTNDPVLLVYPAFILLLPITLVFPAYPLVLVLLLIKNIREPNPFEIVFKHLIYGLGALRELFRFIA